MRIFQEFERRCRPSPLPFHLPSPNCSAVWIGIPRVRGEGAKVHTSTVAVDSGRIFREENYVMTQSTAGGAGAAIESTLQEHRVFEPPAGFAQKARINSRAEYDKLYRESIEKPDVFRGRAAEERH